MNLFSYRYRIFEKIGSRSDAIALIRECAINFWCLAAIQALMAFVDPLAIVDAIVIAIVAGLLLRYLSRVAAVVLFLLSVAMALSTILVSIGVMQGNSANIVLAVAALLVASRAVEATFKLSGRYRAD
jgi:hypothetical protein